MKTFGVTGAALLLVTVATTATAENLPPIPPDLKDVAAVACVRIGQNGAITGAFLIGSTGDAKKDGHLIEWVRQLHWPAAAPGEKRRDTWFPMPIAVGAAKAPEGPTSCAPPAPGPQTSRATGTPPPA